MEDNSFPSLGTAWSNLESYLLGSLFNAFSIVKNPYS